MSVEDVASEAVTATGKVTQVVWSMGDGGTVACTSTGTTYAGSFGVSSSPDCGYRYTKQGTYMVTATSYWTHSWPSPLPSVRTVRTRWLRSEEGCRFSQELVVLA